MRSASLPATVDFDATIDSGAALRGVRTSIFLALACSIAACVPALEPLPKRPVAEAPPPRCEPVPESGAASERGATPFSSEVELAAAKGTTVYLVVSDWILLYRGGLRQGVQGLAGQPLTLCDVTAGVNPRVIRDEKTVRAMNVLARTASGTFVEVRLDRISRHRPRFSLTSPGGALEMLLGAYREARDANRRLHEVGSGSPMVTDRRARSFWIQIARANAEHVRASARQLVRQLVHGMGPYERIVDERDPRRASVETGAARAAKGEDHLPWVDHANPDVHRLMQFGIPKGPVRKRYEALSRCAAANDESSADCDAADALAADPPAIPTEPTKGGTLTVRIRPQRLTSAVQLEVDGRRIDVTSADLTVPVERDGAHVLRASAPRMRDIERTVRVKEGETAEVTITLLPE
jgi:hypothetical protein